MNKKKCQNNLGSVHKKCQPRIGGSRLPYPHCQLISTFPRPTSPLCQPYQHSPNLYVLVIGNLMINLYFLKLIIIPCSNWTTKCCLVTRVCCKTEAIETSWRRHTTYNYVSQQEELEQRGISSALLE